MEISKFVIFGDLVPKSRILYNILVRDRMIKASCAGNEIDGEKVFPMAIGTTCEYHPI